MSDKTVHERLDNLEAWVEHALGVDVKNTLPDQAVSEDKEDTPQH